MFGGFAGSIRSIRNKALKPMWSVFQSFWPQLSRPTGTGNVGSRRVRFIFQSHYLMRWFSLREVWKRSSGFFRFLCLFFFHADPECRLGSALWRTSFKPVQLSILWEAWCGNFFQTHLLKLASIEVRQGREIGTFLDPRARPPFFFGALSASTSSRFLNLNMHEDLLGCVGDVQTKLVESAVGLVCFQFVQGAIRQPIWYGTSSLSHVKVLGTKQEDLAKVCFVLMVFWKSFIDQNVSDVR